jgi:hypothetical protein
MIFVGDGNGGLPGMTDAVIEVAPSRRPLAWLGAFCGAYAIFAFSLAPSLYFANLRAFAFWFLPGALILSFVGLLVAAFLRRPAAPLALAEIIQSRGVEALVITIGMCIGMAAFWTIKFEIPHLVPFYADRLLADVDHFIHFGDPWRWVHSIMPTAAMQPMLFVYFPGWLTEFLVCIAIAAFHSNDGLRTRYLLTFSVVYVLLGNILAAAGASVGPIFYERFLGDGRFAELVTALKNNPDSSYLFLVADRLYKAYVSGAQDIFAGISAMPSIHVAVVTLNALFLMKINRRAGIAAWAFAALIMLCSVYFGWHYAVDGYVSIAVVLVLWRAFAVTMQPEEAASLRRA